MPTFYRLQTEAYLKDLSHYKTNFAMVVGNLLGSVGL